MDRESPKDSSKRQEADQIPKRLMQALIQSYLLSRRKNIYLIIGAVLIVIFSIWATLPETSKKNALNRIGFDSSGQQGNLGYDQRTPTSNPTSLKDIDRGKLRFGLTLGWQLARFEFLSVSTSPEAQSMAPIIKRSITRLFFADSFPKQIYELDNKDLINEVSNYYRTTDMEIHSAILVGVAAFRISLIGASKDETDSLKLENSAFSAIKEIDPAILSQKKKFFEHLLREKPINFSQLLTFIDFLNIE